MNWLTAESVWNRRNVQFDTVKPIPTAEQLANRISQNPDIARWAVEMAQRRAAIKLEKSGRIPDLSIGGGMKHLNEIGDVALIFGISFPLPLFDRNQGAIRKAEYNLARAFEERKSAEVFVRTALATTYQALSAAWGTVTALKNDVLPGAQSAFDAVTFGYRIGKFDFLEMLDAQRTLFEVRANLPKWILVFKVIALASFYKHEAHRDRSPVSSDRARLRQATSSKDLNQKDNRTKKGKCGID